MNFITTTILKLLTAFQQVKADHIHITALLTLGTGTLFVQPTGFLIAVVAVCFGLAIVAQFLEALLHFLQKHNQTLIDMLNQKKQDGDASTR